MKRLFCATLNGIDADSVEVEVSFSRGIPKVSIVGLPTGAIQESKERVRSALLSNGFRFPPQNITINLSPSDLKKNGSHFDLSIALGIALHDYEEIDLSNWYIFGELGLDGGLKDTKQIFPTILSLKSQGAIKNIAVPKESLPKVEKIPDMNIFGVESLQEAIEFFRGMIEIPKAVSGSIAGESIKIDDEVFHFNREFSDNFREIKGQKVALRGTLIASAGMHNIILEGSPGSGKSMIAKRINGILPPVSSEELLQVAKFEAIDGEEPKFEPSRPFRSPHHTASRGSIFGGGTTTAKVGEVTLANGGTLFFDELPHFSKPILEALREPLQDYSILVSRVNTKIKYPANFLFVGAMNPCPCGYKLSKTRECRCSEIEVKRYRNRLSEPFLDRIDIHIYMQESSFDDQPSTSSEEMQDQILKAFQMQKSRGQKNLNGRLTDSELNRFIQLDEDSEKILRDASSRFDLSFRAINKVKKVARTIADLDSSVSINRKHILEALSFRKR